MDSCANCGGSLPVSHGCEGPEGHRFCDVCAALSEALCIGSRIPVMLYDDGSGGATSWAGALRLGSIVHRYVPSSRSFAPCRYRVRMLDGSLWWGTGPRTNGSYIHLRPMKSSL